MGLSVVDGKGELVVGKGELVVDKGELVVGKGELVVSKGELVAVMVTCEDELTTVVVIKTVVGKITVSVVVSVTTGLSTSPAVGALGSILCSTTGKEQNTHNLLMQSSIRLSLQLVLTQPDIQKFKQGLNCQSCMVTINCLVLIGGHRPK